MAVIITRGFEGATVYTTEGAVDVATSNVAVVDTVGAGDAFVGAVLVSLWSCVGADRTGLASLSLAGWRSIAERAAAAAAITCTRAGADPPFAHELHAALAFTGSGR